MPRKERIVESGHYHVINRGVERRVVFLEEEDFDFFLELTMKFSKDYEIVVHAFCLMTNHYHLLIETKHPNLSKAIQFLNDKYAKYFNKKYTRLGHLWQGRFKSYPLYDDAHFWIVAKYIERNPVKANIVNEVDLYKYQSLFQWKYKDKHYELLHDSMIFEMRLDEYIDYVATESDIDAINIVYDSPKLVKVDGKYKVLKKRLEVFFEFDKPIDRDKNIKKAFEYGYTKSDIARFLELNPSTISRIV